ncbi:MAG: hypothetical protein U9R58_15855 [Chloroflexota bacterium]|nr:hypothetical protein [Chloroflexota bacterium]
MTTETIQWLLESDEPWTRYRTMVDLLNLPEGSPDAMSVRKEMIEHPQVQALIDEANTWPGYTLKRHNDAKHPIYKFSTLADFGVRADDPGMETAINAVLAHQSEQGAFQTTLNISPKYGGTGEDTWTWVLCDAPTLLYAMLAMGMGDDPRVKQAVDHLTDLVEEVGYRCKAAPELGNFRGPGRKADPCPIANVYALKALSYVPELIDSPASQKAAEMLLTHWDLRGERKYYLFGIGTDFRKLKYPFIWYDILHVADVLSRYPFACDDPRFKEMVKTITDQADEDGRYTAGSMYMAWKGWSFADKKEPSPWSTFLVKRVEKRVSNY